MNDKLKNENVNNTNDNLEDLSPQEADVETNEKKSPITNNELISKKIDLSILFHH